MVSRQQLRQTFTEDAALYDRVRPGYPRGLYDEVGELLGVAEPRVLEIGLGTGQATRPMVERGWSVSAVELGAELAAGARRNLAVVLLTYYALHDVGVAAPTVHLLV